MEFKTPRVLLSEKKRPSQSPKTSTLPSKTKALIQQPKAKPNLTESLSKIRYRFLGRKSTSFRLFPLLPQELQILIIVFALRDGGEVIIAKPDPRGEPGWGTTPHSFLSVNQIFRQQTQLLRPKAFALVEKPLSGAGAATASPEGLAHVQSFFLGLHGTVATPAHMDFDFKLDTLAISSRLLWATLAKADVPDLKRLDSIVISWVDYAGFPQLIDYIRRRYPNIREIGLIHQSLLDRGHSRTRKGKVRYITTSGPFLCSEIQMKESLEWEFSEQASKHPGTKVPKVVSLRVARNPEKIFPTGIDVLGRFRDALIFDWIRTHHHHHR
jgi:hypothetical protein